MLTDVAIIGAGPLGIELHIALQRAGISVTHVDSRQIGGTIAWWAPGTRWFSSPERIAIAGVPLISPTGEKTTREEYLAYLRAVVEQFDLPIFTHTRINSITRQQDGTFTLHSPEKTFQSRRVVLATGGTELPNKLNIPGEDLPHVSHYLGDPHEYFRKRVLIVGGKNSAVEAALRIYRAGAHVAFSYHRPEIEKERIKYWLYPEFSSLLKSGVIAPYLNTAPVKITSSAVTLKMQDSHLTTSVPARFVLLLTGYRADMTLFSQLGVELSGEGQVPTFNPDTMETNVKNVYVAGTASAGTQRSYKIFLENCHFHCDKIVAHLLGKPTTKSAIEYKMPET
jgi:thioredoxin reductase (NADPH)